jgi:Reverse transcriptase (RNA-dependent DNA polymerase)
MLHLQELMPSARLAKADCESLVEMDRLRSVRTKVERDVWAARQGATVQCSSNSELHRTQGKSSGSDFVAREDLSGATGDLPPFVGHVKFCKIPIPKNYREARASEQWPNWEAAMVEEKTFLDEHNTMSEVPRHADMKVIPVHWIFFVKVGLEGNVIRYKARLVAQGCRHVTGVDVDEVFAPISRFGARRAILCKAAREDLEVHHLDMKTAFLYGDLEEEVYVSQLPGFHNGNDRVVFN